jgi:endonuclease/exonuclease/phosphatase family metal-dependent hydrolase
MKSFIGRSLLVALLLMAPLFTASISGRQDRTVGPGATTSQAAGRNSFLITSINMHGELNTERVLPEFARYERLRNTDIFLLQEVQGDPAKCRKLLDGLARALSLPFIHMPDQSQSTGSGDGLAVLSRFRLKETVVIPLKRFNLGFHSRHRIALAQTAETPFGDIRLLNLHLDSRINPDQRLDQLSPVLASADPETRPVIIGGDFNTGDYHWVCHVLPIPEKRNQRDPLLRRMAESGFQTPFESTGPTHTWFGLQLDWLFFRRLRPLAAGTQEVGFSDHYAIWAQIEPRVSRIAGTN